MVPSYKAYGLDVRGILAQLGTPAEIQRELHRRNIATVDKAAIEKWIQRDSISIPGLMAILLLASAKGIRFDLTNYATYAEETST